MIKKNPVIFAKELNTETFQASGVLAKTLEGKKWYIIQDCFRGVETYHTRDG